MRRLAPGLSLFAGAGRLSAALLVWGLAGLPPFGDYHGPYGDVLNRVARAERHVDERRHGRHLRLPRLRHARRGVHPLRGRDRRRAAAARGARRGRAAGRRRRAATPCGVGRRARARRRRCSSACGDRARLRHAGRRLPGRRGPRRRACCSSTWRELHARARRDRARAVLDPPRGRGVGRLRRARARRAARRGAVPRRTSSPLGHSRHAASAGRSRSSTAASALEVRGGVRRPLHASSSRRRGTGVRARTRELPPVRVAVWSSSSASTASSRAGT